MDTPYSTHSLLRIHGPSLINASKVNISGAKNAALPILAASLLTKRPVTLLRIPHLQDTTYMLEALRSLGSSICLNDNGHLSLDNSSCNRSSIDARIAEKIRTSLLFLGPLLATQQRATLPFPGGCNIGARPIDLHIEGLRRMGAQITLADKRIEAVAPQGLHGCEYRLSVPSVGATQNLIMAASRAQGKTQLSNIAIEPEIDDLISFLNSLGASINFTGPRQLCIEGKEILNHSTAHTIIGDRIQAGTYLIAAAIGQGEIEITGINPEHCKQVISTLRQAGAIIQTTEKSIQLHMPHRPQAVDICTGPYPQFPTDLQAQWLALNCIAQGNACIQENVYENRMESARQLQRLGAKIRIENNKAYTQGCEHLIASELVASDIRASAGLILACLRAYGTSTIHRIEYADRGYSFLEENLRSMGVLLERQYIKKSHEKEEIEY